MQFDIGIKNFGKIRDAKIKIRPFTVIAGKNSSGKSFVTKSLYSFFSTINKDYVTTKAYEKIDRLREVTEYLQNTLRLSQIEKKLFNELQLRIDSLEEVTNKTFGSHTFSNQLLTAHQFKEPIAKTEVVISSLFNEMSGKQKFLRVKGDFSYIEHLLDDLKQLSLSPTDCLVEGIKNGLINAFKDNFQVSSLKTLKNYHSENDVTITFDFDRLGEVKIVGENLSFSLDSKNIDFIQKLHNVVYLESPVYWKIKGALLNEQVRSKIRALGKHNKIATLSGVPQHFYDLVDLLGTQSKSASSIELHQGLNESIGGEIVISSTGELSFLEKGIATEVSLHNTALGVTNLGIISLLLKKGVLTQGSFLFIDEPEVHLHPAWQKVMIDTLYVLSKQGVNVVIASHSIDMMKCVENIMNRLPENEMAAHFGINQLNAKGESIEESPFPLRKIAAIKAGLGEPFYEMMMESNAAWDDE